MIKQMQGKKKRLVVTIYVKQGEEKDTSTEEVVGTGIK